MPLVHGNPCQPASPPVPGLGSVTEGWGGAPRCHSGLVPGSLGKRARGHTVGPEPSRMSPQSGFLRVRGCGDGRKKVLRAEAGAGRQCVWVRQMRGSEVISEWRRGGQVEAGGLTQGSRAWLFPARTTGHQLVLDRGKSPGNSCHHSSQSARLGCGGGCWGALLRFHSTVLSFSGFEVRQLTWPCTSGASG